MSARDIARAAESLDKLAWHISEQCPDEQCCRDLQAYLGQLKLYCHQLKITAAVKADLNTSMRETVSYTIASTYYSYLRELMGNLIWEYYDCRLTVQVH